MINFRKLNIDRTVLSKESKSNCISCPNNVLYIYYLFPSPESHQRSILYCI